MGDFKIDKMLGLKELQGFWVNGDCRKPIGCNGMFVEARNFGSFSSGPGFATMIKCFTWFVAHPEDYGAVQPLMPSKKPGTDDLPGYVPTAHHMLPTMSNLGRALPALGAEMGVADSLKAEKQKRTHPTHEFLDECRAEWKMYIKKSESGKWSTIGPTRRIPTRRRCASSGSKSRTQLGPRD